MEKASRQSFGEALVELGKDFPQIVALDADLSKSTMSGLFAKAYPDRFFQMGIAEANMIGVAAGMAFSGKIPFLCSFGAFLTGRFDIIRVSVGYAEANVRLVGTHAGVGIGDDGCSQMAIEDIACMRTLPGMAVLQPADDTETKSMMRYLVDHKGPVYLRLTRQPLKAVSPTGYKFQLGKAVEVFNSKGTGPQPVESVIFATGAQVGHAVEAAQLAAKNGRSVAVLNFSSIKPIDESAILSWAKVAKKIITAEDHQVMGGLGGAVAEVLADNACGVKLVRVGVKDVYGESGLPKDVYRKHGLDSAGILEKI